MMGIERAKTPREKKERENPIVTRCACESLRGQHGCLDVGQD